MAPSIYWLFAFALASGIFIILMFVEKYALSDDAKTYIGLWAEGEYQESWYIQFNKFFDFVFGEKHITKKCFLRSACVSIATCILLYFFLAHILQVFGSRTEESIGLISVLSLGILLNVVPDYLSLLQTRWLLSKLKHFETIYGHLFIFLCDLLLSSLIILISISLYQIIKGGEPKSAVEILALFSVYSIFFYSTFSTSLWAWVYCVSAALMKFVSKPWVSEVFYQPKHPMRLLALTTSITTFILALMLTPLFLLKPNERITVFDDFLCSNFPDKICIHNARMLSETPSLNLEYLTKGCIGGSHKACTESAIASLIDKDVGVSYEVITRLCEKEGKGEQKNEYCYVSGLLGLAENDRIADVEHYLRLACFDGHVDSCRVAQHVFSGNAGDLPENIDKQVEFGIKACLLDDYNSCTSIGMIFVFGYGDRLESKPARSKVLLEKACDNDYAPGCLWLGNLYLTGGVTQINGVNIPNIGGAAKYWKKSCELGDAQGCEYAKPYMNK